MGRRPGGEGIKKSAISRVAARLRQDVDGFTLIELMVVLLILGILLAIAIPTFLGATKGASDKAAQSDLTTAIKDAQTVIAAHEPRMQNLTTRAEFIAALATADPDLNFTSHHAGTDTTTVSVYWTRSNSGFTILTAWAPGTKMCWAVVDGSFGIVYGYAATLTSSATCKSTEGLSIPTATPTNTATATPTGFVTALGRTWPTTPNGK